MRRVVVIGAGLAGLVAALRLAEEGASVTVIAKGLGTLALSPGTIDVLGYDPDRVADPGAAMPAFLEGRPGHPYAHLAGPGLDEALAWFVERVPGMRYTGDEGGHNLLLPSAVGVARPTALAPASMAGADLRRGGRFVAVGLSALKDFFPRLLADNLVRAALPGGAEVQARCAEVAVSPRPGRADVAGPVFARALDEPPLRAALAQALRGVVEPGETVLVPAVLGLARAADAWDEIQERVGAPVAEVPTVPPSVPGMRLNAELSGALAAAGGRLVAGPEAVGCEVADGRIAGVRVRDAARTRAIAADAVVLASGGFASGGIELDSHGVLREVVLGLPVAGPPAGSTGLSERHLDHQPLMTAGVLVDADLRPTGLDGAPVWPNLFAAGSIVAGAEAWREKSGEGIAVVGGYRAAGAILEDT